MDEAGDRVQRGDDRIARLQPRGGREEVPALRERYEQPKGLGGELGLVRAEAVEDSAEDPRLVGEEDQRALVLRLDERRELMTKRFQRCVRCRKVQCGPRVEEPLDRVNSLLILRRPRGRLRRIRRLHGGW